MHCKAGCKSSDSSFGQTVVRGECFDDPSKTEAQNAACDSRRLLQQTSNGICFCFFELIVPTITLWTSEPSCKWSETERDRTERTAGWTGLEMRTDWSTTHRCNRTSTFKNRTSYSNKVDKTYESSVSPTEERFASIRWSDEAPQNRIGGGNTNRVLSTCSSVRDLQDIECLALTKGLETSSEDRKWVTF